MTMNTVKSPILFVTKTKNKQFNYKHTQQPINVSNNTHTDFWTENLKGKDHLGDTVTDGSIILRWMLMKQSTRV